MSTIQEAQFSPQFTDGDNASAKRTWFVFGAADEQQVRTDMVPYLTAYNNLLPRSLDVEHVGFQATGPVYKATVQYGALPSSLSGGDGEQPSFAFEFGGATAKMLAFLEDPVRYSPPDRPAPDNNGFINVKSDGTVEGVEVPIPSFGFSLTKFIPLSAFTAAYQNAVGGCVKRTNASVFWGHAAGTVLLDQVTGSGRGQTKVEITFRFQVSPDAFGLKVGKGPNAITGINKPGWHYLSVTYEEGVDANGKHLVPKPIGVEVGPVFYTADFSVLGL